MPIMKSRILAVIVVSYLMGIKEAGTDTGSDLALASKFPPILVLTQDTGNRWEDIRVTKPEPVRTVFADKALVDSGRTAGELTGTGGGDPEEFEKSRLPDTRETGKRIARKLAAGALAGIIPSYALGIILTEISGVRGNSDEVNFGAGLFFEASLILGYPVGAGIGVSWVDPRDRFILSLAGSAVGFVVGIALTGEHNFLEDSRWETWPIYTCPLIGATVASELWRKPLETRRVTIDVMPDSKGHLSVGATLHF